MAHKSSIPVGADPEAVWLVTGCSSGFGKAISAALAARDSPMVATARRPEVLTHLDEKPRTIKAALDVTKPDTIASALRAGLDAFGRIDVVVNNAGIGFIGPVARRVDLTARRRK